jgi:sulfite reductase beta subunit-like hemoprotein
MSTPAAFEVKGWCPGALRPMESGDGLIVRIRPRCASVCLEAMRGIAEAAATHGNGHIDLTRRANLQIRGVSAATLGPLTDALRTLGLLDGGPEAEAVRNILVSPLAGIDPSEALDMRPIALELVDMLAAEPETWALPGKFAFVLDGGGRLPLSGERADLRLLAIRVDGETLVAIGIDGANGPQWLRAINARRSKQTLSPLARSSDSDHGHRLWPPLRSRAFTANGKRSPSGEGQGEGCCSIDSLEPLTPTRSPGETGRSVVSPRHSFSPNAGLCECSLAGEGARSQSDSGGVTGAVLVVLRLILTAMSDGSDRLSDEAIANITAGMASLLWPVDPSAQPRARGDVPLGHLDLGDGCAVLGVGVPFGGLEASQLRALADAIAEAGGEGVRLSPWRVFYIPLRDAVALRRLMARARSLGLVVDAGDPLMRIQACPGHPACRAAYAETRKDARRLAAAMARTGFSGTAHLSGCAKGCASSLPADLTLVGAPGGYRLLRSATARDEGGAFINPADIGEGILHG